MNEILEKIDKASHIVLISDINPDAGSIGSASAMYSFLLQKHKKVSWFCKTEVVSYRFSFIAWVEKIRDSFPASADLAISLGCGDKKYLGIEPMCDLINIERHFLYDFKLLVMPEAIFLPSIIIFFLKILSGKLLGHF